MQYWRGSVVRPSRRLSVNKTQTVEKFRLVYRMTSEAISRLSLKKKILMYLCQSAKVLLVC